MAALPAVPPCHPCIKSDPKRSVNMGVLTGKIAEIGPRTFFGLGEKVCLIYFLELQNCTDAKTVSGRG